MSLNSTAGDPNADSYASVADTTTYFTGSGNTTWTGALLANQENALRIGTRYLDDAYRLSWIGIRSNLSQSLAWPRMDGARGPLLIFPGYLIPLFDIDGFQIDTQLVPVQVQRAAMEAAVLSLGGEDLLPLLVRGNQIKSINTVIGSGAVQKETVWQDGAPAINRYTVIEGLLRGLVTSSPGAPSGTMRMVRG